MSLRAVSFPLGPLGPLGVVRLTARFPRLPGDIGNPESFPFPVGYRRVEVAAEA